MFVGKAQAYLRVEHLLGAPLGYAPALISNIRPGWLAGDKHSSLLRAIVNYGRKKFYTFAPGGNLINFFSSSRAMRTNALAYSDRVSSMKNKVNLHE